MLILQNCFYSVVFYYAIFQFIVLSAKPSKLKINRFKQEIRKD